MKKGLFTLVFAFIACILTAQPQPVGHLTIFSEDGDKFFLILNGERQNNVAQTNLRVEDLPQPYYNAKVIFEDQTLGEISKNYLQLADAGGVLQDVTYKIKKNKNNGKMTLNYFSMVPVRQNYVAPSNVTVVRYGQPQVVVPVTTGTTVTQTTTTTTNANTAGVNMNVGGINVGVTVTDPLLNGTVQTTTTHTTTNSNATITPERTYIEPTRPHVEPTRPAGCSRSYAMSSSSFASALATIKNQSFDETRLKTAKQIASSNCLSASQVAAICKEFGFEQTKLDFAKYAYNRCTEPSNYFQVNNVFGFSSSVDELNDYITTSR